LLHAKRPAQNHCVLGQTCGRRAPNPVFHSVFVEDVKSSRQLKSEFFFILHVTSSTKTWRNTRLGARLPDVFPENTVTSARSLSLRQDPLRNSCARRRVPVAAHVLARATIGLAWIAGGCPPPPRPVLTSCRPRWRRQLNFAGGERGAVRCLGPSTLGRSSLPSATYP